MLERSAYLMESPENVDLPTSLKSKIDVLHLLLKFVSGDVKALGIEEHNTVNNRN